MRHQRPGRGRSAAITAAVLVSAFAVGYGVAAAAPIDPIAASKDAPAIPATKSVKIKWAARQVKGFTISGKAQGLLSPGTSRRVNLVITNPSSFAIRVTEVAVEVGPLTSRPACSGKENLVVTRNLAAEPIVPKKSSKSLHDLGISKRKWPRIMMPDLPTNQDACKATTFILRYTGTAVKA